MHQLLHGHVVTALRDNALLVTALPFAAYYFWRRFSKWRAGELAGWPKIQPRAVVIFLVVMTIFTVLRNIPVAPFTWLSPA